MAAEAYFYLGNTAQARDYINVVRSRAAAAGRTTQMEITSAQVNLNFILDERARELCGEFTRWYDLKRTGQLLLRVRNTAYSPVLVTRAANSGVTAGGNYGSNAAANIKDFHVLRPIPQTEIDRTSGKITQNPGY